MSNPIVLIDLDGVLCNTGDVWYKWLQDRFDFNDIEADKWTDSWGNMDKKPYNLTKLFNMPSGVTGFEFWYNQSMYDILPPADGAISAMSEIKSHLNMDIVVASRVIGNHYQSKLNWVRKHFPMVDSVYLTESNERAKTFIKCDAVVEDSLIQLQEFSSQDVLRLHWQTPYVQEGVVGSSDIHSVNNWNDVVDWLEATLDV